MWIGACAFGAEAPAGNPQPPAGGEGTGSTLQLVPAAPGTSHVIGVVGAQGLPELLQKAGYTARAVAAAEVDMGALDSYGTLLVDLQQPLSVTAVAFLRDFVARGGRLIACSWGPAVSPRLQAAFPAYRLQEVLQIKVGAWSSEGNVFLRSANGGALFRGLPEVIDCPQHATPLVEPAAGARVGAYWLAEESADGSRRDRRSPAAVLSGRCAYLAPNVLEESLVSRNMLRLLVNAIAETDPGLPVDGGRLLLAELSVALEQARRTAHAANNPDVTAALAAAEAKATAAVQLAAETPPPAPPATPPAGGTGATAAQPGGTALALANGGTAPPKAAPAGQANPAPAAGSAPGTPDPSRPPALAPAAVEAVRAAIDDAERVALLTTPCRTVEARGVFVPQSVLPPSRPAIAKMLDDLRAAGVNIVFPEVYCGGLTLAPGPSQDARFAGHDPLTSLLAEAAPRGIEVHAWISLLGAPPAGKGSLLAAHPQWAAQTRSGARFVADGRQWLCPSQVDVRDTLCEGIRRSLAGYNVQGFVIDGVDYGGGDACYDPVCVGLFRGDTGRNPRVGPLAGEWQDAWLAWRRNRVTTLVRRVIRDLRTLRPGVPLQVGISSGTLEPRSASVADWRSWAREGWIDGVCPEIDTGDVEDAGKLVERAQRLAPGLRVLPVLETARARTAGHALDLVGALDTAGGQGVLFDLPAPVAARWGPELGRGPFRQAARLPWRQ